MNKKELLIVFLTLLCSLGALLIIHTKYTALVYAYRDEISKFSILSKENKTLKIEFNNLSSPERIINFAIKNLNLELPKAQRIYFEKK